MKKVAKIVVILAILVMVSSQAFAAYEDVHVVRLTSDQYACGVATIKLYLNYASAWEKQLVLYNGTPMPDHSHPVWAAAEAMTFSNTTLGADAKTRRPAPYIFSVSVAAPSPSPNPIYDIYGDAGVLNSIKAALSELGTAIRYCESASFISQTPIGKSNLAIVCSAISGYVIYVPVKDEAGQVILNEPRLKSILAIDSVDF